MKKYEKLRTQYPEYISLDQLRVICKIAKRSALYLVENGIIPAIDTGRKTWKYKISIDDVIAYLCQRDKRGSMIPDGAISSGVINKKRSYSQVVEPGQEREVVVYFKHIYADYPDVLTVSDMAVMTGLCRKSLQRIIYEGHINYLEVARKYIIPKVHFWDYIASRHFIGAWSNSDDFIRILEGFEEWRQNR